MLLGSLLHDPISLARGAWRMLRFFREAICGVMTCRRACRSSAWVTLE